MRLCHGLNLQCSALALISHFLPSLNGADQIKPCQHQELTGGWCFVVNVASMPWWPLWKHGSSTPLGSRGPPSLLSACRLWPFKAGRIMGEGHVGSTRASRCPPRTPAPRLLSPLSSHKKTNRMKPHYLRAWMMCRGLGGRCLYVPAISSVPQVQKGRFTVGSSRASSLWKTEKG